MNDRTTLILGAGFSGRTYGRLLAANGVTVYGTTRSMETAELLRDDGIQPVIFDGQTVSDALADAVRKCRELVVSIAPDSDGDPVLRAMGSELAGASHIGWIAYLSTVGVYGNHNGAWVDEETPIRPVSDRSRHRAVAENAWAEFSAAAKTPVSVLRLSGIYGPGRNQMVALEKGTARRLIKKDQVFNRIHVADIARALDFLATRRLGGLWNVTDNRPAPPQDVVEYCASVMKIDPPAPIDFETATLSPMARSFYGENKRVSNRKIKDAGFDFQYPDYETAFARMWKEDTWR